MPFFSKSKNNNTTTTTGSSTMPTTTINPATVNNTVTAHSDTGVAHTLKDVREFEHGRQKAKKTARTQSWREDKAVRRSMKVAGLATAPPPQPTKRTRGSFQAPPPSDRPDREDEWAAIDAEQELFKEFIEEHEGNRIVRSESGGLEVDLTNLMKPAKARKSKRVVGDFEVLPSLRQVVALDDRLDGELEADEPWEHLSATDEDDSKDASYAKVAAFAC
ncbi:hypothetical protein BXZ70DRAFT_352992 [Cristinia sonorae]|uniref:Uncharacterized protein n=1 Tax=Cristinia sonorae TaxID=1940300 RepID=A0A8K0UJH3_9AGAR|nr:hypothetical protein BXZ70DRAFT_352992 [Cristinia sonorae]